MLDPPRRIPVSATEFGPSMSGICVLVIFRTSQISKVSMSESVKAVRVQLNRRLSAPAQLGCVTGYQVTQVIDLLGYSQKTNMFE